MIIDYRLWFLIKIIIYSNKSPKYCDIYTEITQYCLIKQIFYISLDEKVTNKQISLSSRFFLKHERISGGGKRL